MTSGGGEHPRLFPSQKSAVLAAAVVLLLLPLAPGARATDSAGHALAQKFADAADAQARKKAEADRLRAEEAEMLERAAREAAERQAAQRRAAAAEAERLIEEEKKAELERFVKEAEAKQREERRLAEEAKKEREARKAEKARRALEERLVKEALKRRLAAERAARETAEQKAREAAALREAQEAAERQAREAAEGAAREAAELEAKEAAEREAIEAGERLAKEAAEREARETAERKAKDAAEREAMAGEARARYAEEVRKAQERRALEEQREEEVQRLSDRLKILEAGRPSADKGEGRYSLGMPGDTQDDAGAYPPTRVTVLLVMEPGTTGIRRYGQKTADPVLCIGPSCWVSAGPERGAVEMARGRALGPGNTLGRRAAACNRSLACVFRDVDLNEGRALVQPVDLRILRHDRRQALSVTADRTCAIQEGHLSCATLFQAKGWRAWVVPEQLAVRAGPGALTAALATGLLPARAAGLGDAFRR